MTPGSAKVSGTLPQGPCGAGPGKVARQARLEPALVESAIQEAGLRALERWSGEAQSNELEGWLLRVAFGFSIAQIARAFLSDERTVAQRIVRAKQRLCDDGVRFEVPEHDEVPSRLRPVLDVLYQLFTEGYSTTDSEAGIDEALCNESLSLASHAAAFHPRTSQSSSKAAF